MHIAIAGNIGSGKTTLTHLLAKHYGHEALFESIEENPYLQSFYEDMRRWSFNLQIYFLHTRFSQVYEMKRRGVSFVQDRTLYEDAYIFAPNLQAMGLLNTRDMENYLATFNLLTQFITAPDLIVYLQGDVPTLIRNIQHRGREYESSIRLDYLTGLNERYDEWARTYDKGKLIVVNIDELNFAREPEDLGQIINMIDNEFHSLFNLQEETLIPLNGAGNDSESLADAVNGNPDAVPHHEDAPTEQQEVTSCYDTTPLPVAD